MYLIIYWFEFGVYVDEGIKYQNCWIDVKGDWLKDGENNDDLGVYCICYYEREYLGLCGRDQGDISFIRVQEMLSFYLFVLSGNKLGYEFNNVYLLLKLIFLNLCCWELNDLFIMLRYCFDLKMVKF